MQRNPRIFLALVAGALLLAGCDPVTKPEPALPALQRVAFGSCSRQDLPQPLWTPIAATDPDLWIWMGDNIYADTEDMTVMAREYARAKAEPGYRALRASTRVIGTWDDHDLGWDNVGKEYPKRRESQQLFLDFLDVPASDARRTRAGVYSSHTYGPEGKRVKFILLDTRYHRDAHGSNGTILGEEQWAWLEQELRGSTAQINVIVSSIQVIPDQFPYEKWGNFPRERDRLLGLIGETRAPGVVLLSGDRHFAEIMRIDDARIGYPLYEITSSGMTDPWFGAWEENRYRQGDPLGDYNFGLMEIDWTSQPVQLRLQIRDRANAVRLEQRVALTELVDRS